jgi:hypothetical protein
MYGYMERDNQPRIREQTNLNNKDGKEIGSL